MPQPTTPALWDEINTNPASLSFPTISLANAGSIATVLNAPTETRNRRNITLQEVWDVIGDPANSAANLTTYKALNIQQETRFWNVMNGLARGELEINGRLGNIIQDIIPAGDLRDGLTALATEDVSRAEILNWPPILPGWVALALQYGGIS